MTDPITLVVALTLAAATQVAFIANQLSSDSIRALKTPIESIGVVQQPQKYDKKIPSTWSMPNVTTQHVSKKQYATIPLALSTGRNGNDIKFRFIITKGNNTIKTQDYSLDIDSYNTFYNPSTKYFNTSTLIDAADIKLQYELSSTDPRKNIQLQIYKNDKFQKVGSPHRLYEPLDTITIVSKKENIGLDIIYLEFTWKPINNTPKNSTDSGRYNNYKTMVETSRK